MTGSGASSLREDRAFAATPSSPQAVSPVPASIPLRGKSQLTELSHRYCYETTETIALPGVRKEGLALAEISLADCEDGWRASHGFGFSGGDYWGSWSPVFSSATAYPARQEAIAAEAEKLEAHIAVRTGKQADKIRAWLAALTPEQTELFADAIADRNPSGGDVKQAPSRSDESGGADRQSPETSRTTPRTD